MSNDIGVVNGVVVDKLTNAAKVGNQKLTICDCEKKRNIFEML